MVRKEPLPRRADAVAQRELLHLIRRRQPVTRAELAEITGLPLSTVAFNANRLLRSHWIYEAEGSLNGRGRPARYLHVNGDKMGLVGIDIGVHDTAIAIADYNSHVLFRQQLPTGREPKPFLAKVGQLVRRLIDEEYQGRPFESVGVSVPGLVDRTTGTLVRGTNIGWHDVPVGAWLQEQTKLPVMVENDANTAALAEMWHGGLVGGGITNMIYLLVVDGLGSALVVDGKIYHGSRIGTAGFGHFSVDPNGPVCNCGGRGCLEVFLSNHAILTAYLGKKVSQRGVMTVTDLINLSERGDERAITVLKTAGAYLAEVVRGLVHGLTPQMIVIGGEIAEAWPLLEPMILEHLKSKLLPPRLAEVKVRPAIVRNRPSLIGAITLGVEATM